MRARGRKQCSIVKLHTASKVAPQKVGRRLAGRVETIAQARGGGRGGSELWGRSLPKCRSGGVS